MKGATDIVFLLQDKCVCMSALWRNNTNTINSKNNKKNPNQTVVLLGNKPVVCFVRSCLQPPIFSLQNCLPRQCFGTKSHSEQLGVIGSMNIKYDSFFHVQSCFLNNNSTMRWIVQRCHMEPWSMPQCAEDKESNVCVGEGFSVPMSCSWLRFLALCYIQNGDETDGAGQNGGVALSGKSR